MSTNCYNCKNRGTVPGSTHSRCNFLKNNCTDESQIMSLEFGLSMNQFQLTNKETGEPLVNINEWGQRNGWASWPIDFDPIWIDGCVFEVPKEELSNNV